MRSDSPGPVKVTFSGNRVFAHVIKLILDLIGRSPKGYYKRNLDVETCRDSIEKQHMKLKAEGRVRQLQAKEQQRLPEATGTWTP